MRLWRSEDGFPSTFMGLQVDRFGGKTSYALSHLFQSPIPIAVGVGSTVSIESSGVPVCGRKDMLASVTPQCVSQADHQCAEVYPGREEG